MPAVTYPSLQSQDNIGSFAPKSNPRAYTTLSSIDALLPHTLGMSVPRNSTAALHLSTHRQVPQRKGHSLLPSKLPRSCPVTRADSARLLAPTYSISHADVPHTGRRKKKTKPHLHIYMVEGKEEMAESNPLPCCNRFSLKLVMHSAIPPKGLVEAFFFSCSFYKSS